MIRFACPGCSATFTVADEKAGKTGKCPKCQSQFVIPAAPDAGADAPPPLPDSPKPPPLPDVPPPAPRNPNDPIEIQPCPKCGSRLSVLPTDVGLDIECPSCQTVFKALRADAPPPPDTGSKTSSSKLVKLGSGSDRDDDDRPSKKKSKRRDEDDEEDDRPSKRRSRRDDDEDDDRPSRRSSRRRSSRFDDDDDGYRKPDRASMIMIFTIIGLILCWNIIGIVLNILSIVFASMDLKEMDAGQMDATNRGQVSTCRTLSIIGLCAPLVIAILWCGFVVIVGASGAAR